MKQSKPDIFQYIDYRLFLNDYYKNRKSEDKKFTHEYICRRLGQAGAKSYFSNVIKRRLNLTSTFMDRFICFLELNEDEAKYFRALVNYNQAVNAQEKEFSFDQIVRLNRAPKRIVDDKAYMYYKEWYHTVIRAILDIIDFKDDFKALVSKTVPSITISQARDSIALLSRLQLIARNKDGFWKPTEKVISTSDMIQNALIEQFQVKCLEHAKNFLLGESDQTRRNITLTLSLSDQALHSVISRAEQFKSEIRSIIQKDDAPASKVYHINVNLFPMSR